MNNHRIVHPILSIALLLTIASSASGQWVQTNGPYGGNIQAFASIGPNIIAGNYPRGIYHSTDSGLSWALSDSGLSNLPVHSFAVSGEIVFAGTKGGGVFISTDSGSTWNKANSGLPLKTTIVAIALLGANIFAGSSDSGVYLSTDIGLSWNTTNIGLANKGVFTLTVAGSNLFAATHGGVFRSSDSGKNWVSASLGLTTPIVNALICSDTNLFAATVDSVFLSTNNGATWIPVDSGLTYPHISVLTACGTNLFAGTNGEGVFISANQGISWRQANIGVPTDTHLRGIPTGAYVNSIIASGGNIFAGTVGGIFRSSDNGVSWDAVGLTITMVPTLAASGRNLFAGASTGGVFRSSDNGATWVVVNNGLTEISGLAETNLNVSSLAFSGTTLFAGCGPTQGGLFRSSDNGASWISTGDTLGGVDMITLFVDGQNLYGGADGQFFIRSTDGGTDWQQSNSNGLTDGTIYSYAVIGSTLFAGTGSGVFRSSDNGMDWVVTRLMNKGISSLLFCKPYLFAGSSDNSGLFRSTDSGMTWTESDAGLTNHYVNSLIGYGTNLLAGTKAGVFLSSNNGSNWTAVNSGLKDLPVLSIQISDTSVFVGTGEPRSGTGYSGVWRRPLSEMIPQQSVVAQSLSTAYPIQSYPNPFTQSTKISFTSAESGAAEVTIVNLLGEEVARLFEGTLGAGEHSFEWDASAAMAGTYFCVVRTSDKVQRAAMVVSR